MLMLVSPPGWTTRSERMAIAMRESVGLAVRLCPRLGMRLGTRMAQNPTGTAAHREKLTGRTGMWPARPGTLRAARMLRETRCNEEVSAHRSEGQKTEKNRAKTRGCQKRREVRKMWKTGGGKQVASGRNGCKRQCEQEETGYQNRKQGVSQPTSCFTAWHLLSTLYRLNIYAPYLTTCHLQQTKEEDGVGH
jgi:hypothetical protein